MSQNFLGIHIYVLYFPLFNYSGWFRYLRYLKYGILCILMWKAKINVELLKSQTSTKVCSYKIGALLY